MTIGDLIRRWLDANREFAREQSLGRAVTHQSRFKTSEVFDAVHETFDPVFVLSTGRVGTKLVVKILDSHPDIEAFHEPVPGPDYYSTYAYKHWKTRHDELKTVIDCARYQVIRDVFLADKKYVEANNRITFFAHQIAELYPRSKFVHLIRNPNSFIRSGRARRWYSDKVITDEARIRPESDPDGTWSRLTDAGRIAWLWNETNQFIHDFKETLPSNRVLTLRAEDLFSDPDAGASLFRLVGIEPPTRSRLEKLIRRPVNRSRPSALEELSDEEEAEIEIQTPLATTYYPAK